MDKLEADTIRTFDHIKIKEEIINVKKTLFDFRLKKATRQPVKPHLIKSCKKQLAILMTIEKEKFMST